MVKTGETWAAYIASYGSGQWRDRIFRDMVLADARPLGPKPTILDIGCGEGLDGDIPLQRSIAEVAGRFIGVEPDPAVTLGDYFTETHRCPFEAAPLPVGSVDLAYAVMVLEHLSRPEIFWGKLFGVLADGGVFWGLTVDGRHLISRLSLWADRLRFKNLWMDLVLGRVADSARYKNYRTYYRTNSPAQIGRLTSAFRSSEFINFSAVGQWGPYLPSPLRWIADGIDRRSIAKGRPGTLLAVRVVK